MKKKFNQKRKMFRNGVKPTKRGIVVKGSWKAVELDHSLFSEQDMGGLVCFEELTDYRLVDSAKVTAEVENKKEKRAKKRKASEGAEVHGDEPEAGGGGSETRVEPAQPPKKKKKKNTKKAKKKNQPSVISTSEVEDVVEVEQTAEKGVKPEKNVDPETKKKKERKKKVKEPDPKTVKTSTDPEPAKKAQKAMKKVKNWADAALSGNLDSDKDLSSWKDLFVPEPVLQALGALGFSSPTPIQALALPPAIRDRMDILGAAETGSGKTLAFGIPMIHSILEWRRVVEMQEEPASLAVPTTAVKSLYLPDVDQHDGVVDVGTQEFMQEEESQAGEEKVMDDGDQEELEEVEEDMEEEDDDVDAEKLQCVKVIEDVEFDFDLGVTKEPSGQKTPLLGLVLTPTRELAVQVKHHIDAAAQFTGRYLTEQTSGAHSQSWGATVYAGFLF